MSSSGTCEGGGVCWHLRGDARERPRNGLSQEAVKPSPWGWEPKDREAQCAPGQLHPGGVAGVWEGPGSDSVTPPEGQERQVVREKGLGDIEQCQGGISGLT